MWEYIPDYDTCLESELYYVRTQHGDVVVVNDSLGDIWLVRELPLIASNYIEALICLQLIEDHKFETRMPQYKDFIRNNELIAWCHRII